MIYHISRSVNFVKALSLWFNLVVPLVIIVKLKDTNLFQLKYLRTHEQYKLLKNLANLVSLKVD